MPELPEVESVVRSLQPLQGRFIETVHVCWDGVVDGLTAGQLSQRLTGRRFGSIGRIGKYILCAVEADGHATQQFLVIHLRMTGRLYLAAAEAVPNTHTRLIIAVSNGRQLIFDDPRKFGRVSLVDDLGPLYGKLGPDALKLTEDEFRRRIAGHNRQLKTLLLEQSFIAGIGNIYADEILFRSGLHPLMNCSKLSAAQQERLYSALSSVLGEAVEAGGANIDGVFKAGGFRVAVYGREGRPCVCCGTAICKIRVAQRGTHFCPACQPA